VATHGQAFLFEEGPGLLSRWPIVWSGTAPLPHDDLAGLSTRKVIAAHVEAPNGRVGLFSTHMTIDEDASVKADQAKAAYDYVAAHVADLATFFAGDLNAEPDALAMEYLRGQAMHAGTSGDLVDAWMTVNPADPGFSFSSSEPNKRIDYIYASPGGLQPPVPTHCEIVFDEPVAGTAVSDHLGVLCSFALPAVE
jgi:endonuclease/exonuclease/phosphatase family metal-dependent hydrolase